jgi:hypothetical protein
MDENNKGKILIYQTEKGDTKIDVFFQEGNIWMTQKSLADLYQVTSSTMNEHIKNIIADGELSEEATIRKFRIVQQEGDRFVEREPFHYSFQMILAVGYRVRSRVGVHFRNWASRVLTEYVQKGFVMNDERLKNPKLFGADYFDELLERIRDIRSSEKRFYEKIKDIYKTSVDYDKDDEKAKLFFKTVQNKLHYSVHGHTAAELIAKRADAAKDNMGLTSFEGAKVRKKDVDIAKNYLNEGEIKSLNRLVTMYLDYAEDQAQQHIPMYMTDWGKKLNDFLSFTGRKVLEGAGRMTSEQAKKIAEEQYILYDQHRKDIEKQLDELLDETKRIGHEKRE